MDVVNTLAYYYTAIISAVTIYNSGPRAQRCKTFYVCNKLECLSLADLLAKLGSTDAFQYEPDKLQLVELVHFSISLTGQI